MGVAVSGNSGVGNRLYGYMIITKLISTGTCKLIANGNSYISSFIYKGHINIKVHCNCKNYTIRLV